MKKILAILMAAVMVMSLGGCGSKEAETTTAAPAETAAGETTVAAETPVEESVVWPASDTVKIIVPNKAGGAFDNSYRALASAIERKTGVTCIVENQPDGSGTIGYELARNSEPDGSTLLGYSMIMNCAHYYGTYEYSAVDDFTGIGETFGKNDRALVVSADAPWQTFEEFVADAKANPDTITCGYSVGGVVHYAIGAIMNSADISLRLVDAAAETDKVTGILGGYLDCSLILLGTAHQYVESGDMRVLAVAATEKNPKYPDYPTMTELGYDTFAWDESYIMWAPPGMDEDMKAAIRKTLGEIFVEDQEFIEQINSIGFEVIGNFTDERCVELDTACHDVAVSLGFTAE